MSKKILLVEDEALIAMNEAQMLKNHGYEVVTAYNGEKAVEMAENNPEISLILMDIDLGKGMAGTEAAEKILENRDVPIAFLSSHTEPEVVEKTEGITSYGYIVKNSGETVLLASIRMAFRLYEAHMELKKQKETLNSALTQYEQTAEELAEKEALYRNLMENSADGVELLDEEGNYLNVNQKECEMLGYSREELLNMKIADIDPNYPKDGFYHFWKEQNKGTSIMFETLHRHKNGTFIPVEVNGIFFEVNKKKYLFGVARDLTDRKRTEEALREKEAFTKTIMDHLPIGIAVNSVDPAVEFSYMNDNFPKIYRTTREALANPDVFWDVVYEDPEFRQKIKKRVENDCASGNPEQMQWQDIPFTRSGEGPFYISARNIPIHGTKMMISTVWDMTERKLAEDRLKASEQNLRTTLNSIGDAVISTDTEGAIIRMNPVAENLCGWSTGEAKGKALEEVFYIVHADTGEAVDNPVAKVLESGKVIGLANHTMLISRNGTEYQIADSAAPIIDDNGHATGVVLVFRDVTVEYEKGRELQEWVKELRSIEWMLSNKTTQQSEYISEYGDLSTLNKDGIILHSVGKEHLKDIASEYLDLLETSTAIYEKDGNYALGIFASGWCRLMDSASRRLCITDENKEALESGKWLCHESCWEDAVLAMEKDRPVEVECHGGITMYAVPIHANGEIVGAMNFGYGNPPTDESELVNLSKKYQIPVDELRKQAKAYRPRPQFIIDYAKERIRVAAKNLGHLIEDEQQQKEIEQGRLFLSSVLDYIKEAIIICNERGEIIRFNESARRIHGLPEKPIPPDQWAEHYDLYYSDGITLLATKDIPLFRALNGEDVHNHEIVVHPKDGPPHYLSCNGSPLVHTNGETIGAVIAMHEITEYKKVIEEKNFLMRELNHRVKNNHAMVSSLISLKDSETEADLSDIKHQIEAIGLIHEKLYRMENVTEISCREYFDDLLSSLFFSFTARQVRIDINVDEFSIPAKSAMPLGLIINEIATNAIKYGFTDKEETVFSIKMKKGKENNEYKLTLSNTGNPFPENIDIGSTTTLGFRLINALVSQIDGTINLKREPYPVFTIRFPIGEE